LILFACALQLIENNINIMNNLIIDAVANKIFLILINNKNIYTSSYENSKSNYEKLVVLINEFLINKKILIDEIDRIYVNRGPGSFAGIRNSLSIVKGLYLSKNIDYFCFSFFDFISLNSNLKKEIVSNLSLLSKYHNIKYEEVPDLCDKFKIKKNLIKPLYLS
jgi:tRNA A37 threonylcarbamoyladenosine modification protein TsaB